MTAADVVALPLWLVVAGAVLALWSVFDRMLVPSIRWFVRRRLNRVIDDLNARLQFQIPRFASTRRQVLIDRLTYDPEVLETVDRQASASGTPRDVLIAEAARYAREIVPSFNAYAYFRIGHYVARRIIRLLYRVRLGSANEQALSAIDPKSSIVFVINHRSNMDYLILAYMIVNRSALSYAVGEWARIWPLQSLLRQFHRAFPRRAARDERQRLTGSSVTDGACASLRNKTSGLRVGPVSMPWANACSKGSPALAPGGGRLRSATLSAGLVTAA